jgi:uncharacterized integral membrane protein
MSCEHLICAHCSGPVAEGRCPSCRAARTHIHRNAPTVSQQVMIAVGVLLAILLVILAAHV